jgi:hypothetical protein
VYADEIGCADGLDMMGALFGVLDEARLNVAVGLGLTARFLSVS